MRLVIIIGHFQSLKSCGNKQVLIKPVKSFELIFKRKETEINMEGFLRGILECNSGLGVQKAIQNI